MSDAQDQKVTTITQADRDAAALEELKKNGPSVFAARIVAGHEDSWITATAASDARKYIASRCAAAELSGDRSITFNIAVLRLALPDGELVSVVNPVREAWMNDPLSLDAGLPQHGPSQEDMKAIWHMVPPAVSQEEGFSAATEELAGIPTPLADTMRPRRITSAEWDASTAAAARGIRGGWQRGSDFVHVVAVALGMSGGSAMASANTARPAPAEDLREYFEATEALIVLDGQTDDPAGFIVDWASDDLEEEDQAKWERFCDARDAIRAFDTSAQGQ